MDTSQMFDLFSLLFKHAWLLFIAITCLNAIILKTRSKKYIERNSSLEEGYNKLFWGYLFYMNLPWVALGIGMVFGKFNSVFDILFGIRGGNPFALLFLGTVIVLWVLTVRWIYFRGGAEFLVEHPGVFTTDPKSPNVVKMTVALMLAGGVFGLIMMGSVGQSLPR